MKGFVAVLLFVACFVGFSVDEGSALKCYQCQGIKGQDSDCIDDVKKATVQECPAELDACYTMIASQESVTAVIRSCIVKDTCKLLDAAKTKYDYCKTCTGDLCNTDSSAFVPSYSTSMLISLVFFALTKLFM